MCKDSGARARRLENGVPTIPARVRCGAGNTGTWKRSRTRYLPDAKENLLPPMCHLPPRFRLV